MILKLYMWNKMKEKIMHIRKVRPNLYPAYFSVVSWGLKDRKNAAFRPAMALSSGELSAIGGTLLLMTATATARTVRLLMSELPEVRKWKFIFNSPMRKDITIVIPHPDVVSAKFEVALMPFVARMKLNKETYLILVRGKY